MSTTIMMTAAEAASSTRNTLPVQNINTKMAETPLEVSLLQLQHGPEQQQPPQQKEPQQQPHQQPQHTMNSNASSIHIATEHAQVDEGCGTLRAQQQQDRRKRCGVCENCQLRARIVSLGATVQKLPCTNMCTRSINKKARVAGIGAQQQQQQVSDNAAAVMQGISPAGGVRDDNATSTTGLEHPGGLRQMQGEAVETQDATNASVETQAGGCGMNHDHGDHAQQAAQTLDLTSFKGARHIENLITRQVHYYHHHVIHVNVGCSQSHDTVIETVTMNTS